MKYFNLGIGTGGPGEIDVPHMPPGKYLVTLCADIGYENLTNSYQTVHVSLLDTTFWKNIPANSSGQYKDYKIAFECRVLDGYPKCSFNVTGEGNTGGASVFVIAERLSD